MNLLDLVVTIKAEDQASSSIQGLSTKAMTMGSAIGTTLGSLASAGIQKAASAIIDFGKESIQTGMNFDSAMSQVAATMGLTTADIGDLTACAKEMGATTAFSATEAAEGLNYMALAGYSSEEAIQTLPTVLNLAAAGAMDLGAASDMVTDAQTALGLSLEETTGLVDQMAQTSSKSNTSVSQLGDAILTVGGTAKNLSGGVTEMNTVLGLLADNGIKGSEAGTHLRNMILSLTAPTDTAAKALADLGVSATDAEGNMRPLEDVMQDFNTAFADMTAEEKTQALNKIFNKTDLAAVNALLDTSVERWDELGAAIEDSAGAAEKMAQTQLDNLAGDVTLLQSAVEGVQIELAAGATPALREMAQVGSQGLSQMASQLQSGDLIGGFETLGQTAANVASVFLQAMPSMVDAGMKMLFGFISGFGQGLPQMIPSLVQCVLGIAEALISNVPVIINAGMQLLVGLATGALNAIPTILAAIPSLVMSVFNALVAAVPTIVQAAIQWWDTLATSIPQILPQIVAAIPQIVSTVVTGLLTCIPQLVQGFIQLFMAFSVALPQIIVAIVQCIPQIVTALVESIMTAGPQIVEAFLNVFNQLPESIQGPLAMVGEVIMTVFNGIASIVGPVIEAIGTGIGWLADQFSFLSPVIEGIGGVFNTVAGGIGAAWDFITGKSAESSAQTSENVTSNMSTMEANASSSMQTLQNNADSSFSGILSSGQSNFESLLSSGESNFSQLNSTGTSNLSQLNSSGSSSITSLSSTVSSQTSSMLNTGSSNFNSLQSKGSSSLSQLASTGTSSMSTMSSNVSSNANSMDSNVSSAFNNITNSSKTAFTDMSSTATTEMTATANAVQTAMQQAADSINQATSQMTSAMQSGCSSMTSTWASMSFSTPHIPLPHFSVSGRLDPNVPSVPSFSVSWYKKGAILDGATIFGMMGDKLLGGGEAGKEAVLPIDKLKGYVRDGVREEMKAIPSEHNFVFNVTINNSGQIQSEGRAIGEALYQEFQRLERRTA